MPRTDNAIAKLDAETNAVEAEIAAANVVFRQDEENRLPIVNSKLIES